MSSYSGRKAFITGGSAGIGRAAAEQLARQGASVVIAARGQGRIDETVAAMKAVGAPGATFGGVSVDVTDADGMKAAAAEAIALMGGVDLLICNSGYAVTGPMAEVPDSDFRAMMDVNYLGHVFTVRAFIPHFTEQKRGDICLVTSMLGFTSLWGYGAYSASKFAIVGLAEALRQEMKLVHVDVTVFYPPTTKTPGLEKENEDKHPILWALESESGWNKVYEADEVATVLLQGIRKKRFHSYVGWDTWVIYTAARHLPGFTRWMSDIELKKAAAKVAAKG
jgi:3-dehydrosphinganine reductase